MRVRCNQLIFVFNIYVFGAVAGAGILGAQFYGSGNHDGMRYTFLFKFLCGLALSAVFALAFFLPGETF